ncbi:MAG: double-strand break repair protein AddB, partial [Alphaproteobacteria bacterium]|nr:double-strand break repair protein AddB [Alphaproteobacteria bacterium]
MMRVATIPPDASFLDELAKSLWRQCGEDPIKLSDMLVLLPNRRACRQMREAFLQVTGGRAALLPSLRPLGDMDEEELSFLDVNMEIPPAVSAIRRQMLLVQLIKKKDKNLPLEQAAELATSLAKFLDQAQIEGSDFADLKNLVKGDLAEHWQETLDFLEIITLAWPSVLAEEGCIDPAERRNRTLAAQADAWRKFPVATPVIAAGSTGSMPMVAEMLSVIASLPQGLVVLPGLDVELDEDAWQSIDENHPQYGMKKLLEKFGVQRNEVEIMASPSERSDRVRIVQEAMRPADAVAEWRNISIGALSGLSLVELDQQQEEAEVIALRLREVLEHPTKTAMLVTTDRALSARVIAALRRWNVDVNDSAGSPLSSTPVGSFLSALYQAASDNAAAIEYLTLLKHPLAGCGVDAAECRSMARRIERDVWRGFRRTDGWSGAAKSLQDAEHPCAQWCGSIAGWFAPITDSWQSSISLEERIKQHIDIAEIIASTDVTHGSERLWRDVAGEAAATWLN